ncbi:MAG: relaxase/mobilization nuclease domain-containing protein [Bryobacteraceae bacterium]|jgi:hypothetical protein
MRPVGGPEITNAVIESMPFAQPYTSGVLSFAAEETAKLDDSAKQELMDSFESMVAPGMEPDRLSWVWVQHREHGRTELHWVVANVDLETHKRFAPYYDRADRGRFAAWQQYQNHSRGLADPQDPERRRASVHNCRLPVEKRSDTAALEEHRQRRCADGELRDRAAIVQYLTGELGLKVLRRGKDYITVQYGEAKNERLPTGLPIAFSNARSRSSAGTGLVVGDFIACSNAPSALWYGAENPGIAVPLFVPWVGLNPWRVQAGCEDQEQCEPDHESLSAVHW